MGRSPPRKPATTRMPRILLVEDSPDNMKLVTTVLKLKGHEVIGLTSGDGMMAAIAAAPPDLVLMDIQLPGKDGFQLLREIRADTAWKKLRVVALTAHAMEGDRDRAMDAGFDGYITKPIDVGEFPQQVLRALKGERVGSGPE